MSIRQPDWAWAALAGARIALFALLLPLGASADAPPRARLVATVTAVDGDTAYLIATDRDRRLAPGTALSVLRDGRRVAGLVVCDGEPLRARGQSATLAEPVVIGDECYASEEAGGASAGDAAAPDPDPANGRPPDTREPPSPGGEPIVATVTAVEGPVIYLRPAGEQLPKADARLVIEAGGQVVAVLEIRSSEPYSADLIGIQPGVTPGIGDQCRLAPGGIALPPPPAPARPELPKYVPERPSPKTPGPPRKGPPLGSSILGPTGIIRMPSAEVQPPGRGAFAVTHVPGDLDKSVPGNRDQEQYVLGAFPQVELGNTLAEYFGGYDITAHGKTQLLKEGRLRPAVALGAAELGRNELVGGSEQNVVFGAASKHFLDDRLRVTLGYASRGLNGPYAGLEFAPETHITLLGEYDTRRFNWGMRISPTARTRLAAALGEGGWDLQFGYNWATMPQTRQPAPDVHIERPTGDPRDWESVLTALQRSIVGLGLENVKVSLQRYEAGYAATVEYENRRYSHNELEVLGRVLRLSAEQLPESVGQLRAVTKRLNRPIATCTVDADGYVAFMSGRLRAPDLARHIELSNGHARLVGELVACTREASRSHGRVDLTLRPDLMTRIGTEDVHVATGWALEPELATSISRGTELKVRSHFPVAGPLQESGRPFGLAAASHTFWLGDELLARGQVGRFPQRLDGFYAEALYLPPSGHHLVGLSGGAMRHQFGPSVTGWDTTMVGRYRYNMPRHGAMLGVSFGRYLAGDWGVAGTIRRDLGDTILTAELARSELGARAGLWIDVPLGSGVAAMPATLRSRLPGYFEHGFLVGAGETEDIDLVGQTAREADTGGTLLDEVLNRDRLNTAYLRTHVQDLKRAGGHAARAASPLPPSPARP